MKVFVTGGTGLVGSYVIRTFLANQYEVIALTRSPKTSIFLQDIEKQVTWIQGDILDITILESAIQEVDYVIHAAAVVSFLPKDTKLMYEVNVQGTANVVNVCLKYQKRLCFVSSIAALGRTENTEIIDETQKWENSDLNSYYAQTKYLAELEVWRGEAEGLNMVIINPSLILGIADWNRSSTQLIKYAYEQHWFYPPGSINYVDVRDVAQITYLLTISHIRSERFIVNAGKTTYKILFQEIAQRLGRKPPRYTLSPFWINIAWRVLALVSFFTRKPPLLTRETAISAQKNYFYQNEKIKKALNYQFKTLTETLDWVCSEIEQKNLP
ncbi:MAG: NAD-dependent epimerase/dehydratase family protein [Microscillaceae bacterium]|nr:NAD-dependent epimerase/dehydratase family protein [Microscillaceae bacterium]MDW8460869.1 NAD-dependent epimerase/dehydratase family protein [Cytophagales bacterium]